MVEGIAHRVLDDARGLERRELVLGLALEFGLADEDGEHRRAGRHHVVGGDLRHALRLADALGMVAQAAQQRDAQALLMGAALGRGNGVAVGGGETVLARRQPGDRPFERAMATLAGDLAGEDRLGDEVLALDLAGEIVAQAAGEAEHRLRRDIAFGFSSDGAQRQRISTPPKR